MRRLAPFLVLVVVAAVAVIPSSSGVADPGGMARFRENDLAYSQLGTFPGATEAWRTRILLIGRAQAIGYGQVACIYVDDGIRQCNGTYILPRGRISVSGGLTSRQKFRLTIVGGTGVYAGAGGELTAVGGGDSRVLTFNFT